MTTDGEAASSAATAGEPASVEAASVEAARAAGREVLLALADDEVCMGHWYATWMGLAPFLEEDLATTSIGQDELGHARALFGLLEPGGDLDALAYGRAPEAYRCAWLVERPSPTWEELFVRHLLYDEAEAVRWEALAGSSLPGLSGLAERALVEEAYHTRHARSLLVRLARGGPEARRRLRGALDILVPLAEDLFEPVASESAALATGVVTSSSWEQAATWRAWVEQLVGPLDLDVRWSIAADDVDGADGADGDAEGVPHPPRGRRGVRSPDFAALHEEMTRVYALDPSARW